MSSKARLVITAVVVEKQPVAQVVRDYGVSRSWVYELVARYRAEGEAAFEPRSRRPKTSPTAIPPATVTLITDLRGKLTTAGLDAWAGHHRLAPRPPPRHPRLGGHHQPLPDPARAGHPAAHQAPQGLLPAVPGRAAEPMLAGRLHSLPARRPPATNPPPAPGADLAGRPQPLRPGRDCPPARDRPDRARPLPGHGGPLRRSGLDLDRQRDGLHHPLCWRPRRP